MTKIFSNTLSPSNKMFLYELAKKAKAETPTPMVGTLLGTTYGYNRVYSKYPKVLPRWYKILEKNSKEALDYYCKVVDKVNINIMYS